MNWRTANNVPIFVGETGENSNEWMAAAANVLGKEGIGFTNWNIKRINYTNHLLISDSQENLLTATGRKSFLQNILFENCSRRKDVADALTRQARTMATIPFADLSIPGVIHAVNYDMGREGYAYKDERSERLSHKEPRNWNASRNWGGYYRNDGVDIEQNSDEAPSNGYNVAYMPKGEWLNYTVNVSKSGYYSFRLRVSNTSATPARLSVKMDDTLIGISSIDGNKSWFTTDQSRALFIPEGLHKITIRVEEANAKLNWIEFIKKRASPLGLQR